MKREMFDCVPVAMTRSLSNRLKAILQSTWRFFTIGWLHRRRLKAEHPHEFRIFLHDMDAPFPSRLEMSQLGAGMIDVVGGLRCSI